ncbi:hypothetical protein [Amycolatopsis sp. cmx-11-51]|uniref:hypothetical protein n=1 Tax=Amycolatopsis sp. cmx-11-51 TaxID=2785797 RepID=UPI0039E3177E
MTTHVFADGEPERPFGIGAMIGGGANATVPTPLWPPWPSGLPGGRSARHRRRGPRPRRISRFRRWILVISAPDRHRNRPLLAPARRGIRSGEIGVGCSIASGHNDRDVQQSALGKALVKGEW